MREELDNIKVVWWVFPEWAMGIGFVLAIASFFYFDSPGGRICASIASLYCATQIAYRAGVYYGFSRGFREGHEEGVERANARP